VVLLRGNGSPRTFRLSIPAIQRSLTGLGFAFAFAIVAALLLLLWNLLHLTNARVDFPASPPVAVTSAPTANTAPTAPIVSSSAPTESEEEIRKEIQGLHEEIAKMSAEANGRKNLAVGANSGLLQFFGPRNVMNSATPASIEVKNVKVGHNGGETTVDFEVTNVDPDQKQVRGYIVVLAKTPSELLSYPEGVFNPDQNVVLDYTKGETFGVSRLRPTRATFHSKLLDGSHPRFQILLFHTDGTVISDFHVEAK
jgi:hypothetical protein